MIEVFHHAVALVNLPFTLLLLFVLLYWVASLVGMLDLEFLSPDFDGDGPAFGGLMGGLQRFLYLDAVPFMVMLSVLSVLGWMLALITNGLVNPAFNPWVGLALIPPVLLVAALGTRLVLTPLRPLFARLRQADEKETPILGRVGVVITSEVTDRFGMAELENEGAPLRLQVRVQGRPLKRGSQVLLVALDAKSGSYFVRPSDSTSTLPLS